MHDSGLFLCQIKLFEAFCARWAAPTAYDAAVIKITLPGGHTSIFGWLQHHELELVTDFCDRLQTDVSVASSANKITNRAFKISTTLI